MADDFILVKHLLLNDHPAWCCLHTGYHIAMLFFTRMNISLYQGMPVEEARAQFQDSVTRATAAIMAMNRDALVQVVREAAPGEIREEAMDMLPVDNFKAMVDNVVEEVKALRKVNGDE